MLLPERVSYKGKERETCNLCGICLVSNTLSGPCLCLVCECAPTLPGGGPYGQGTSEGLCVEGLCHQWTWEVLKSRYQGLGLGREKGEAMLGLRVGIQSGHCWMDDFYGVAWD